MGTCPGARAQREMIQPVLDTTRPGQQTEMTPESNCSSQEPRIDRETEAWRQKAPCPRAHVQHARIKEAEWDENAKVT